MRHRSSPSQSALSGLTVRTVTVGKSRSAAAAIAVFSVLAVFAAAVAATSCRSSARPPEFDGRHFSGRGDVEYLKLLEFSRRLFAPDPEFQNLAMLYQPAWNGLVEGPTWDAWWIQNSYGTAYGALPFLEEPFVTFLQNCPGPLVRPDGGREAARPPQQRGRARRLASATAPGPAGSIYKQGDGRTEDPRLGVRVRRRRHRHAGRAPARQPRRGGDRPLSPDARADRRFHRFAP